MQTTSQDNSLKIGSKLLEFEILSVLGSGGFGITYKVRDTNINKTMVIKEYMPSQFSSRVEGMTVSCNSNEKDNFKWGLESFLEEAKVLSKFDHINIIKATRLFKANGTAYFVMDFYEGETLEDYLKRERNHKFTQDEITSVLMPILEGLKAVHKAGFLHRDIAPDNIFMRQTKPPILIDFGASRNALGVKSQNISAIVKHGYSPPEQYTSTTSKQNKTTDLYAVSAVIFHLITNKKPIESTHRQTELLEEDTDPLEDITKNTKYTSKFTPSFLNTVSRGLSIRQKDRIASVEEYQRGLVEEDEETQKIEANPVKSYHKIFLIIISILLLTIGIGVWYIAQTKENIIKPIQVVKKEKINEPTLKNITTIGNLMWQGDKNHEPISKKWVTKANSKAKNYMNTSGDTATTYCSNLSLGGYSDWRLPTIDEFKEVVSECGGINTIYSDKDWNTITDKNRDNKSYQSCYKSKGFLSNDYWSSTSYARSTNYAWTVYFKYGYTRNNGKNSSYYVRCVRAGQ